MKHGTWKLFFVSLAGLVTGAWASAETPPLQSSDDQWVQYRLTKGRSIGVCQAYLQRLQNSRFDPMHRPYCDRPEDDSVPGFESLTRVALQPTEVNKLYKLAFNFELPPHLPENDGTISIRHGGLDVTRDVGGGLDVWRYSPPVEIFNNGVPTNILMWRGVGLGGGPMGRCGIDLKEVGWGVRSDQMPLVFIPDDATVDQRATNLLIAHPVQKYDSNLNTGNLYSTATGFRPIARSIGIFKYRGLYYLDGFFDIWGDARNERRGRPSLANTLAVFLHKDGATRQICEYQLSDGRDYPKP